MGRQVDNKVLLTWLDWVAKTYHSGQTVHALSHLRRMAVKAGLAVPSLAWLKDNSVASGLPVEMREWYTGLNKAARARLAPWIRALMDIHYYLMLAGGGNGPIRFVANHADVYADKIGINYANLGNAIYTVEYLERARIINNPFFQRIDKYGYPLWVDRGVSGYDPPCAGQCLLLTMLTSEAGHIDLSLVSRAREILESASLFTPTWQPIKVAVVQSDFTYSQALAAYLGLEVDDVQHYY
jgi:hypothetical protein